MCVCVSLCLTPSLTNVKNKDSFPSPFVHSAIALPGSVALYAHCPNIPHRDYVAANLLSCDLVDFFFKTEFNWKGRYRGKIKIFHLLIHSPGCHNG